MLTSTWHKRRLPLLTRIPRLAPSVPIVPGISVVRANHTPQRGRAIWLRAACTGLSAPVAGGILPILVTRANHRATPGMFARVRPVGPSPGGVLPITVVRANHRSTPGMTYATDALLTGLRYLAPPPPPSVVSPLTGARSRVEGDVYVGGDISALSIGLSYRSITDDTVSAGAGVRASKCQQQFSPLVSLCNSTTPAAVIRLPIHAVSGVTATILRFSVWAARPAGVGSLAVIGLFRNNVMILTSLMVLDCLTLAYQRVAAKGFTSVSLVAGDVLEVAVVAASGLYGGTMPTGIGAQLVLREDAQ